MIARFVFYVHDKMYTTLKKKKIIGQRIREIYEDKNIIK